MEEIAKTVGGEITFLPSRDYEVDDHLADISKAKKLLGWEPEFTFRGMLLDFIKEIEKVLGKKAKRNYMPLQKGDVKQTLSNTNLLKKITRYNPKTNFKTGIRKFLDWYLNYYN